MHGLEGRATFIMGQINKKYCTVYFEPPGKQVKMQVGKTILEAANEAGIYTNSVCGGVGYCGKCKVIVSDLGKIQTKESIHIKPDEKEQGIVLACLSKVLDDVTVTVPESLLAQTSQILTDEKSRNSEELFGFEPLVIKRYIEMSPPTVHDHTADKERLYAALHELAGSHAIHMDLNILQNMSKILQNSKYKVTVK
jgi:uncharacterized 2Fe-2S/4Fe-4S cluster protein (DUF4445 family)